MRKLIPFIAAVALCLTACISSEQKTWDKYADWRELNDNWLAELEAKTNDDGTPFYIRVSPDWNPGAYVLVHYFNDPAENADKLSPLYTSTIDVRYQLHLADGTAADSSDLVNAYGALGVFRTRLNEVVMGWPMAMTSMHCGDTIELIVPYGLGYGASENGVVNPYSNLRFNIRLVDIPFYEKSPY